MTIHTDINGAACVLSLCGRLDTTTAPLLEAKFNELSNITELTIDFLGLEYLSSAGLRVLLIMQKSMNRKGTMVIKNVNAVISEVFEVTGFADILTVE